MGQVIDFRKAKFEKNVKKDIKEMLELGHIEETGEFKEHFYSREELEPSRLAFVNACGLKKHLKILAAKNYAKKKAASKEQVEKIA